MRSEFQRALTEPPPTGARAAAWWPLVIAVERIVEATTATRVRIDHGVAAPPAAEVAAITRELEELAATLRAGAAEPASPGPPAPVVEPAPEDGDEDGVLAPLRHEVRAARAIAAPGPR